MLAPAPRSLLAAGPSPAAPEAALKTALTVVVATKVLTEVTATEAAASATALLPIGCVALGDVAQPAWHLLTGLSQHLLQRPAGKNRAAASSTHSSEAACQRMHHEEVKSRTITSMHMLPKGAPQHAVGPQKLGFVSYK